MMGRQQYQQSRVFHEVSSLLHSIFRSNPSSMDHFSGHLSPALTRQQSVARPLTLAGLPSLMLGVSIALMLCGSLTFFIGLMLIPWVLGLAMLVYFVGFVSSLTVFGRTILYYATSSPPVTREDISAGKLS